MKYLYCLSAIVICLICVSSTTVYASEQTIEVFEDGSYIETIVGEVVCPSYFSRTSTISNTKTSTYKTKTGEVLWTISVKGKFSYNGISAKCISSSISTTCPGKNWKLSKKSATKSGATATATATANRYVGNTHVQAIKRSVHLTCSKDGKFS